MNQEIKIVEEHPLYSPESLARFLDLKGGESTIRKLRLQGRLPVPDIFIGKRKLPRWRWGTIQNIIERGEI
jgi:hypothetical protein